MSEEFQVSVIIPVYNREAFIRKSVESANCLPEVGEVLIVDDGSTDGTILICQQLENEYPKVKLLAHPDKKNHGVSASRNLGIVSTKYQFIAFLDSDDYYLPNRFIKDKEILIKNKEIDGVYNALGIHYYNEVGKEKFINAGFKYQEFLTLTDEVPPEDLFFVLFNAHNQFKGDFSTITVTLRKQAFEKAGLFPIQLRQKEDIHLWRRMAAVCELVSGNIKEAVATRGVHESNTMTSLDIQPDAYRIWWKDLNKWMLKNKIRKDYLRCFQEQYLSYKIKQTSKINALFSFIIFFVHYPHLIKKEYGSFDIFLMQLFGRKKIIIYFLYLKNKVSKTIFRREGTNSKNIPM